MESNSKKTYFQASDILNEPAQLHYRSYEIACKIRWSTVVLISFANITCL